MAGHNILPAWNEVEVVKGGPATVTLANGATESAKQLAKAGVVVAGVTQSVPKHLSMNLVIQIMMITAAALMVIFCKAKPKAAVSGAVWQNGMVAVVAIYGIAWMCDTYFSNYTSEMNVMLSGIVEKYPWSMAFVFFLVSVLINS